MPLFRCSKCNAIENTACCRYWTICMDAHRAKVDPVLLCSECDPEIGKWHGRFPKQDADEAGYVETEDGRHLEPTP